jgi:GT2 family glycosyltransferase
MKVHCAQLIENAENIGFARANNQAYAVSTGKYFPLLNPDTVVRGDALKKLVGLLDNHGKAGFVRG